MKYWHEYSDLVLSLGCRLEKSLPFKTISFFLYYIELSVVKCLLRVKQFYYLKWIYILTFYTQDSKKKYLVQFNW